MFDNDCARDGTGRVLHEGDKIVYITGRASGIIRKNKIIKEINIEKKFIRAYDIGTDPDNKYLGKITNLHFVYAYPKIRGE